MTQDPALFSEGVRIGSRVLWLHTFGERYIDPDDDRPPGPPRLPDDYRPLVVEAIPHEPDGMPETIAFDAATRSLHVGSGRIEPVEPEMWAYEVSGMKVVKRWFDRRKREPDGRHSSPLDAVVPSSWEPAWTTELLELLNVLGLLVRLEPEQAELLDKIADGQLVTVADLTARGVLPVESRPTVEKPSRAHPNLFSP